MRAATTSVKLITFDDSDIPAGICLGADFCAEHEMGMEYLERELGVGTRGDRGLAVHLTRPINVEEDHRLAFYERKKATKTIPAEVRLAFDPDPRQAQRYVDPKDDRGLPSVWMDKGKPSRPLATGWADDCFVIRAFGEAEMQMVRDLYEGFQKGDVLLSFGGSDNPFDRGGPCLTLRSRMSDEQDRRVIETQDAHRRLQEADAATGIHEKLKKAGRRYYALRAVWKGEDRESAHPVIYWLNPMEQREYNYGWFTVEDLEAWARGEGPVMMSKQTA